MKVPLSVNDVILAPCQPFGVAKGETTFWRERIQPELDKRGWRDARLAQTAGIPPSTLSRWRRGPLKQRPDTPALEAVARAFGLSLDQLLGTREIPNEPQFVSGALTKEEHEVLSAFRDNDAFRRSVRTIYQQFVKEKK